MTRSLAEGRRVILRHVDLFSDGTAVRQVGKETLRIARQVVDEMITVDTDSICTAIKGVFQDTRRILEPAGALPVAGMKAYLQRIPPLSVHPRDECLIAIAGGANMNFERLGYITERAQFLEATC